LFHEIAALLLELLVAAVADGAERLRGRALPLILRDVAVLIHLAEDIVAAVERLLRGPNRIIVRRCLRKHGEIGRLSERQLIYVFVEIGPRGGLHAVGVAAEEDRIEVKLEDLLLGQCRFKAKGEDRLAHLAANVVAAVLEQIFGDLLRDRRPALGAAASSHALGGVVYDSAEQASKVDSMMVEEVLVLGGNEGLDDERRIFIVRE